MANNKKTFITKLTHNINFLENVADSSAADLVRLEKYNCWVQNYTLVTVKYVN